MLPNQSLTQAGLLMKNMAKTYARIPAPAPVSKNKPETDDSPNTKTSMEKNEPPKKEPENKKTGSRQMESGKTEGKESHSKIS